MKAKLQKYLTIANLLETLGWFGVLFVFGGYCLLATGVIKGEGYQYHALMLFGSAFLAVVCWRKQNYQPFVLNTLFVLVAAIALVRLAVI